MKPARLLFAVAAFAAAGCSAILGIDSDYTPDLDASVSDGEGGSKADASMQHDATMTGDDAGPSTDAQGADVADAVSMDDVVDSAPALCPDGAASPRVDSIGSSCCAEGAFACDLGQPLEAIICAGGKWIPNSPCPGGDLCRTDTGEYPDGGPENDGSIVGNGAKSGLLGECAAEITTCTGQSPGAILCGGAATLTLTVCGADLTTAYEETCGSAALCAAHLGPHCALCLDGDTTCIGNAPATCSDGGFVAGASCTAGTTCSDGACTADFCSPSAYKCVGSDLQQCDPVAGSAYFDAGLCDAGTCDSAKSGCDYCVKSMSYGCNGTTSYSACNATGTMINTTNCTGTTPFCSQAGGSPKCVACLVDTDCTATPPNICEVAACTNGACGFQSAGNDGTVVTPAAPGACTDTTCQGGAVTPTNLPDNTVVVMPDMVNCTEQVCTAGVAGPANPPVGTACLVGGAGGTPGTCDNTGTCNAN